MSSQAPAGLSSTRWSQGRYTASSSSGEMSGMREGERNPLGLSKSTSHTHSSLEGGLRGSHDVETLRQSAIEVRAVD
jgi:hypothetical protein